jgi:hypothetical protein
VPEKDFEKHVAAIRQKGRELTSAGVLVLAKELDKEAWIRKRRRDSQAFAARIRVPDNQGILAGDMGLLWDRLKDEP